MSASNIETWWCCHWFNKLAITNQLMRRKLTCVIHERSNPEAKNMDDYIALVQDNQFLRKIQRNNTVMSQQHHRSWSTFL